MGIYLGQLPPAEIARLKAELAETLIANFCYPRFFDHRTESLQMRPVDRKKRQEVWLYLSSVDFTAWSRIDLTSPDFQHQIERLFIQFVQRNRSFFGDQGRRRMSDIRMLISSCAVTVTQGLRNHLTGQKQNTPPFGSPRPVVSWASTNGKEESGWEQISEATMLLQQKMQEIRGEAQTVIVNEPRPAQVVAPAGATAGPVRRTMRVPPATTSVGQKANADLDAAAKRQTVATPPASSRPYAPVVLPQPGPGTKSDPFVSPAPAASASPATAPVVTRRLSPSGQPVEPNGRRQSGMLEQPGAMRPAVSDRGYQSGPLEQPGDNRQMVSGGKKPGTLKSPSEAQTPMTPPISSTPMASTAAPMKTAGSNGVQVSGSLLTDTAHSVAAVSASALRARSVSPTASQGQQHNSLTSGSAAGSRDMLSVGEDDVAIFEQMRHQLVIWLRIESVKAGIEISDQGPAQLLEMLRQQAHFDDTRLQVVSTLLNLANQVVKTGVVSVLDYKQALMFHLMHTRN